MNPGPPGIYPGALTTELLGHRYSRMLVGLVQIIHFQHIEEAFLKIKSFIHRNKDILATGDGIVFDMYTAMSIVTPSDAAGYLIHSGYF